MGESGRQDERGEHREQARVEDAEFHVQPGSSFAGLIGDTASLLPCPARCKSGGVSNETAVAVAPMKTELVAILSLAAVLAVGGGVGGKRCASGGCLLTP